MRIRISLWVALVLLVFLGRAVAGPDAWPQFRGPTGQGLADKITLPAKFGEKEGVAWRAEVRGLGHSSPVHDGKTIWLTTAATDGSWMAAVALDAATGEQIHDVTVFTPSNPVRGHEDNSYASPTPVIANGRVFVHFGTYGTACLDAKTGEVLWRNDRLPLDHQGGPGSSPVVFEDLVILSLDGADTQRVVALDAKDGSIRWERKRSAPFREDVSTRRAFSTPLLVEHAGKTQLISVGADQCHAYDPRTGDELWHVRYIGFSNVPRPVSDGKTAFICTGFYETAIWAVGLDGRGNVTDTHVKWKYDKTVPEVPSPVLGGDTVYFVSNKGVLTALDKDSGERRWAHRLGGNYAASPLFAGGLLYFGSEEGVLRVLDPSGDKPKVVASGKFDGPIKASPAVIGEDVLVRTDKAVYRVSGKAGMRTAAAVSEN